MSSGWMRGAIKVALAAGWLAPVGTVGAVVVGEALVPLRVDPALLGVAAKPIPAAPVPARPMPVEPRVEPKVEAPAPAPAPVRAVPAPAVPPAPQPGLPAAAPGFDKKSAPTYVTARHIDGVNDVEVLAEGEAVLQRADDTLTADRIVFRQESEEVEASGSVRLTNPDAVVAGPRLRMRMGDSTGEFEAPQYSIKRELKAVPEPALTLMGLPVIDDKGKVLATTGRVLPRPPVTASGSAEMLEFRGEDKYFLRKGTYSTCAPASRDWEVVVDELELDYTRELGEAHHATVTFMDVPLFYTPWLDFALNNRRKSGFLAPTIGSTSKSGIETTTPWYWNIAPDMDATIAPRVLSRRGVQLNTELRYLGFGYQGQARVEYLPDDRKAGRSRSGYAIAHVQDFGNGFAASLNLNGVSDDTYFSDLSTRLQAVAQGNLLRQGSLSYSGPWYGATLTAQRYQTLQDPANPPLPTPYFRLPQLTGYAARHDLPLGLAFNLAAEYVNFSHPTLMLGKRTTLYPQISLPLTSEAFWLTPKVGVHTTQYALDRQATVPDRQSRTLPVFSVDGGFVMERDTNWFGQSYLQTLEPRAYYLYVPQRDQANIPVFDTAVADFNHAQMFSENRYAGGDRFADANQLTLALSSRLIDPDSGAELLRATLGQRYYFTTQHVTLPGEIARTGRSADMLAALSGQVLPRTYADFGWQYNPRDKRTELMTLGGRYQPAPGKVLNAAYRYARDQLKQIDVSGQWPLFGGWHGVGRYNYSLKESRVVESIAGLEYNAGCWVGRAVVQRLATQIGNTTSAIFFQLELSDFSRIGSNPLEILRRNIPGYGIINQPTADPVFAAQ